MTPTQINTTLAFMERVPLKGNETPQFMECVYALQALAREAAAADAESEPPSVSKAK